MIDIAGTRRFAGSGGGVGGGSFKVYNSRKSSSMRLGGRRR